MEAVGLALIVTGGLLALRGKSKTTNDSTSNTFDLPPLGSASYSSSVVAVAQAIARAEGFYQQGSAPQRAHNPGSLKTPGWSGPTTGSAGINVYGSDDEGWSALYRQLDLIRAGNSNYYTRGMSISQMAATWTGNDNAASWASIVSSSLGTSPSTTIGAVLA
jgi:hypothetical protein